MPIFDDVSPASTVARIRLDKKSKVPIQHQLKRHIQFLVFTGELSEGDRLPSHRDLSQVLGINRNTVSQVYADLESEGWLRGKLGSGTFVHAPEHVSDQDRLPLEEIVTDAVTRALELGYREEDLLRTLQGRLRMRRETASEDVKDPRQIAGRSYL